jgi:hypothetical protein
MINKITEVGLNRMITILQKKLPGITCREYTPSPHASEHYTLYDIQIEAASIARHLALVGYTPIITYEYLSDAAGNINLNDLTEIYINIDSSKRYKWIQVCCILAHELCHKFLYTHFIRYEGMKNEMLTDCCAVYMGFGRYMINGCYQSYQEGNRTVTSYIGYLNQYQLNYIHRTVYGNDIIQPYQEKAKKTENTEKARKEKKEDKKDYTSFENLELTPEEQTIWEAKYDIKETKSLFDKHYKWIAIAFLLTMPIIIYLAVHLIHYISTR